MGKHANDCAALGNEKCVNVAGSSTGEIDGSLSKSCMSLHEKISLLGEKTIDVEQGSNKKVKTMVRRASSLVSSIFSDIRSEEPEEAIDNYNESDEYVSTSIFRKAFPERYIALLVTLAIELPVAFLITGNSEVCNLIGHKRYTLLMAFLPITSAISGNVRLQCSTLTTRAISHSQVRPDNYKYWLLDELLVAAWLSIGVSFAMATISAIWTYSLFHQVDIGFAITIFISQLISVITAGLTGTSAPIVFTLFFGRDSGKWAGPLETAVQDIAGAWAMTYVATWILEYAVTHG
eukprot:CAMPEP_0203751796 /NCGR_PEP_ID=MMETSP0098-20131031/5812_1 /ASSEMBLY_ACC=CAM_ASM_000208 /TAXON_ID=96639 /ORGANISM=" , Strain NY0313808BC1" /LENGTH=291 /DNA_ID=CAMNT_0050641687 /DNA_START=261 /DNA_END=1132 /DNA_ORIENTATION=+